MDQILLTYYSPTGQIEDVSCEAFLDTIIDVRLPYWVSPDVIRAIENGIAAGENWGEVNAISGAGGTTPGRYRWQLQR